MLAKGGLAAATRSLAIEYASRGIRVNAVSEPSGAAAARDHAGMSGVMATSPGLPELHQYCDRSVTCRYRTGNPRKRVPAGAPGRLRRAGPARRAGAGDGPSYRGCC